jgi:carbon storage regulator CsrA
MLILSLRIGESIMLSGGIVIQIQRIRGKQVQIGNHAPPEVVVIREELQESSTINQNSDLDCLCTY